MSYGFELVLDLHRCDPARFTRFNIEQFFISLCVQIDMKRCDMHFWDDVGIPEEEQQTDPQLKGTTAVQFMLTSNITIHTLDLLGKVFLNVFSCKSFEQQTVERHALHFFGGEIVGRTMIERL